MKKIGILGGTFDPVHLGHINLAREARKQFDLDEIRLLTGGIPPHKRDKNITEAKHRHRMVELAVENFDGFVADDFELSKTDYTYTVKILEELKALHPDWDIYFIIGEDSLRDFHLWYKPDEIAKLCTLLVYERDTESDLAKLIDSRKIQYGAAISEIKGTMVNISSTDIRKMIESGEDISQYVPIGVAKYIKEMRLYK